MCKQKNKLNMFSRFCFSFGKIKHARSQAEEQEEIEISGRVT